MAISMLQKRLTDLPFDESLKWEIAKMRIYLGSLSCALEYYGEKYHAMLKQEIIDIFCRVYQMSKTGDDKFRSLKIRYRLLSFFLRQLLPLFDQCLVTSSILDEFEQDFPQDYRVNFLYHLGSFMRGDSEKLNYLRGKIKKIYSWDDVDLKLILDVIPLYYSDKSQLKEMSDLFYRPLSSAQRETFHCRLIEAMFTGMFRCRDSKMVNGAMHAAELSLILDFFFCFYKYFTLPATKWDQTVLIGDANNSTILAANENKNKARWIFIRLFQNAILGPIKNVNMNMNVNVNVNHDNQQDAFLQGWSLGIDYIGKMYVDGEIIGTGLLLIEVFLLKTISATSNLQQLADLLSLITVFIAKKRGDNLNLKLIERILGKTKEFVDIMQQGSQTVPRSLFKKVCNQLLFFDGPKGEVANIFSSDKFFKLFIDREKLSLKRHLQRKKGVLWEIVE
ncbi:MAG: hypothetical protein HQK53_16800 [Oligoflexia bacterium]|nr:hypothetical protein [Oligoflexia bacterium]